MSRRIEVRLTDDLQGGDAKADETVHFSLDGKDYEIDLSKRNAAKLRAALDDYVAAGRRVSGKRRRPAANNPTGAADIRAWARRHGREVSARGRISTELRAEFEAAGAH